MNDAIKLLLPPESLHDKRIKFRVLVTETDPPQSIIVTGTGTLFIVDAEDGDGYEAYIYSESFEGIEGGPGTVNDSILYLDQRAADCLKILDDGRLSCLDPSLEGAD